MTRYRIDTWTF